MNGRRGRGDPQAHVGLDDAPDALDTVDHVDEMFSEEVLRDLRGIAVVEIAGKRARVRMEAESLFPTGVCEIEMVSGMLTYQ